LKTKGFPREFYVLILVEACLFIARETYQPIFTLYLKGRGASAVEIGAIVSILSTATILARFILGPLSDKVGTGWFLLLGLLGQPIILVLYAFAPEISWFYPIQILSALSVALFQPLVMSLFMRIAPLTRRGDALGRSLTAAGLSMLMGPLLSSLLLEFLHMSYGGIFLAAIGPTIIGLFVFIHFIARTPFGSGLFESGSRDGGSARDAFSFVEDLRGIFNTENVAALSVSRVAFAFTLAFFRTLYPLYVVNDLGLSPAFVPTIFTVYGLLNAFTRLPSGRLSDRIGRKRPLLISILLMVIVNLGFSSARDYTSIGLLAALYGACHGARAVSEWTFLGDSVPSGLRGLANSYFANIFDIGTALGSLIGGILASLMPIPTVFHIAAAVMFINAIITGLVAHSSHEEIRG
jgi:MFS family permease